MPPILAASFNYHGPPFWVSAIGVLLFLSALAWILKRGKIIFGTLLGAVAGGGLALVATLCGKGDMTGLLAIFLGGWGAAGGAILGLICGIAGKISRRKAARDAIEE